MPIEVIEEVTTVVVEGTANAVVQTQETVVPLVVGVEGPQGAQGVPGPAGNTYHHSQPIAATIWNIPHNLGYFPNVTVIDSAGDIVEGLITYVDMNNVQLVFAAAFAGDAYLS